jgi:hypothetical protein
VDDLQSAPRFRELLAMTVLIRRAHTRTASLRPPRARVEAITTAGCSRKAQWSRPRARTGSTRTPQLSLWIVGPAAYTLREHDKLGELRDPPIGHQLQVPTLASVNRDSRPAVPTSVGI